MGAQVALAAQAVYLISPTKRKSRPWSAWAQLHCSFSSYHPHGLWLKLTCAEAGDQGKVLWIVEKRCHSVVCYHWTQELDEAFTTTGIQAYMVYGLKLIDLAIR